MDEEDVHLSQQARSAGEGRGHLYESLGGLLQRMLTTRFAVPPDEAEKLVYGVFFEYVMLRPTPDDPKGRLIAMTCESGLTWQRDRANAPSPETGTAELRELRALLLLPEALTMLPKKVRKMLRLRVEETRTYDEIAAELGVSAFYAEAAVKKAWARLRKIARSREK